MNLKQAKKRYDEILEGMEGGISNVTYVAIVMPEKDNYRIEYGFKPIDGETPIETYFKNNPLQQNLFMGFVEKNELFFEDDNKDSFFINFSRTSLLSEDISFENLGNFEKLRPLKGGISIGSAGDRKISGTLGGLFVTKAQPGILFFITCQHVLAHSMYISNNESNNLIYQPSDNDFQKINSSGGIGNNIAVGYGQYGVFDGLIDAAIGILYTNIDTTGGIFNYCGKLNGVNENYELNSRVNKTGRSSQTIAGKLLSEQAAIKIKNPAYKYDSTLDKYIIFKDQIMTDRMGVNGDSGSLLLNDSNEVLGLTFAKVDFVTPTHFYGNICIPFNLSGRTFHNKIGNILSNGILFKEYKFQSFK